MGKVRFSFFFSQSYRGIVACVTSRSPSSVVAKSISLWLLPWVRGRFPVIALRINPFVCALCQLNLVDRAPIRNPSFLAMLIGLSSHFRGVCRCDILWLSPLFLLIPRTMSCTCWQTPQDVCFLHVPSLPSFIRIKWP